MSADLLIPESIQHVVRDLVTDTMYFDESAKHGGSWLELCTWLIRMQAKLDTLLEIGPDGIRRSARMTIDAATQQMIIEGFVVPDDLAAGDLDGE